MDVPLSVVTRCDSSPVRPSDDRLPSCVRKEGAGVVKPSSSHPFLLVVFPSSVVLCLGSVSGNSTNMADAPSLPADVDELLFTHTILY